MDPTRALLDLLGEDDDEADQEVRVTPACFVLPTVRLERLLETKVETFGQAVTLIGTHYRFLMSSEVYRADRVNSVDLIWLNVAKAVADKAPSTVKAVKPKSLREHMRQRLQFGKFAILMLACRGRKVVSEKILPIMWRTLEPLDPSADLDARDLLRMCSRWIGAMSFVHIYVFGMRKVETYVHPDAAILTKDLQTLIKTRSKTLPEQFRDGVLAFVRVAHLAVDAAVAYEALHPSHGECDINMALKSATGVDDKLVGAESRWVPWDRPEVKEGFTLVGDKPLDTLKVAPQWLQELWQLRTFAFFFHGIFAELTGLVGRGILSEGMFLDRYVVTWWELMLSPGVVKLETSRRFHAPALPLILQIGQNQWWLRTPSHIYIHTTFGSVLAHWLELSGSLEDGVELYKTCRGFLPNLPEPRRPVVIAPVAPVVAPVTVADAAMVEDTFSVGSGESQVGLDG